MYLGEYKYKIYFYDLKMKTTYPVTVWQDGILELGKWLNDYVVRWNMQVIRGEWLENRYDSKLADLYFLPREIITQKFATTYEEKMLMYHAMNNEKE